MVTTTLVKKSLGRLTEERLNAALGSKEISSWSMHCDSRLIYTIDGQQMSPGDVATRFDIKWGSNA